MSLMRSTRDCAKSNINKSASTAFTLIEVLVVLVLISILSSMVLTAVRGATQSARIARTRSIIATIDSVLREHYEDYKYRPLAVEIPNISSPQPPFLSFEAMPLEAARARLIMLRDLQRMELPDKVSDVWRPNLVRQPTPPVPVYVAADRIAADPTTGRLRLVRGETGNLADRTRFTADWYGSTFNDWPSRFSGYLTRTRATAWADPNLDEPPPNRVARKHQGAECLYLIMASTYINGIAAIESIPASNIGDTDGDGVPEILDGWGRPLGFIRWPVGFGVPNTLTDPADPDIDRTSIDEFDTYRADFGHSVSTVTKSFSVRPLIISAGPDGEFGIAFTTRRLGALSGLFVDDDEPLVLEDSSMTEEQLQSQEVNYAEQIWPRNDTWMGPEFAGRGFGPPEYRFPDPFLRQFIAANPTHILPGGPLNTSSARSWRDDNISNYQLEASQ